MSTVIAYFIFKQSVKCHMSGHFKANQKPVYGFQSGVSNENGRIPGSSGFSVLYTPRLCSRSLK